MAAGSSDLRSSNLLSRLTQLESVSWQVQDTSIAGPLRDRIDALQSECRSALETFDRGLGELEAEIVEALRKSPSNNEGVVSDGSVGRSVDVPAVLDMKPFPASLPTHPEPQKYPLEAEEYTRYGRQLILPSHGLQGQLNLKSSRVLIVGAGGLGCPAAAYLAGAGAGTLGVVDGDTVERSNLHRQIMHRTSTIGMNKAASLVAALREINPLPTYHVHAEPLTTINATSIARNYDIILDCTDTPASRYLISDTAVLLRMPLVSASALKTDGQLMVLNDPPLPAGTDGGRGGPCYRCIFPRPPPAESVLSCGEGGILGPVVGTMGLLQALEAIKLIVRGIGKGENEGEIRKPSMLIFSATGEQPFRSVRLRGRRSGCAACSAEATLTTERLEQDREDYVAFCGSARPATVRSDEQISVEAVKRDQEGLLVDVRDKVQFELCSLPGSVNVPFSEVQRWTTAEDARASLGDQAPDVRINVICRMGNDSQVAVRKLKTLGFGDGVKDVQGGLDEWRRRVDRTWPDY